MCVRVCVCVCVCEMGWGLKLVLLARNLALYSDTASTNVCLVRIEVLYLICGTLQWNIYLKKKKKKKKKQQRKKKKKKKKKKKHCGETKQRADRWPETKTLEDHKQDHDEPSQRHW